MAWSDLINSLDTAAISTLGGVSATFTPNGGSAQTITGLVRSPAMEEDYTPGSVTGTSVVRLFVRFAGISPQPKRGDAVSINGVAYLIAEVDADTQGGAVLKLRIS